MVTRWLMDDNATLKGKPCKLKKISLQLTISKMLQRGHHEQGQQHFAVPEPGSLWRVWAHLGSWILRSAVCWAACCWSRFSCAWIVAKKPAPGYPCWQAGCVDRRTLFQQWWLSCSFLVMSLSLTMSICVQREACGIWHYSEQSNMPQWDPGKVFFMHRPVYHAKLASTPLPW